MFCFVEDPPLKADVWTVNFSVTHIDLVYLILKRGGDDLTSHVYKIM